MRDITGTGIRRFHKHKLPYADEVTWSFKKNFKFDTSGSFFESLTRSYGINPNYTALIK